MKNFVKAIDKRKAAFEYLHGTFPSLGETKIKDGVGPQIHELLRDDTFGHALHGKENLQVSSNMFS